MTENDYLIAWGLYAFAAVGCLLVWMRLTTWMWRWLREPLRVLMAVLLFSPTIVDPVKAKVAPAIAITALDMLFKVGNNAWRAVSDLFMYGMIAFGVYLVFVLIRLPIERASTARRERAEAAKAKAATQTAAADGGRYMMQCAALRSQDSAESLKARIAFTAGLSSSLQVINGANGTVYKVMVGPFNGKAAADAANSKLQSSGISGCIPKKG